MAITIIKGGKNEFVGHCKWCGCDFRYTEEDTWVTGHPPSTVGCPFCNRRLDHCGEHGTSTSSPSQWAGYGAGMQNILAAQQASAFKGR